MFSDEPLCRSVRLKKEVLFKSILVSKKLEFDIQSGVVLRKFIGSADMRKAQALYP